MLVRVKPLDRGQAARTLAARLAPRVDRVRQIATRFGIRPYRVFLVWSSWSGEARFEGQPVILRRIEILPTPRVSDLTALTFRTISTGAVPEGSIRVDRISVAAYTEDVLRGLRLPPASPDQPISPDRSQAGTEPDQQFDARVEFFWEVVEDGRLDDPAARRRFKILAGPDLKPDRVEWSVMLQRTSRDVPRTGTPAKVGPTF